ncbi:MAG: branched-chain amino acid transaminase [Chloroflexota bacterium]
MVTQQPSRATESSTARIGADPERLVCYFRGDFVPLSEANVSIMTHAFLYGTAVFEGIRAYWNEDEQQLYVLKAREHIERIRSSAKVLFMDEGLPSVDEWVKLVIEVVRRNGFREDAYIRPSVYKSTEAIGVRLHGLAHDFYIVSSPFGDYIDTHAGIRVKTSSWRRTADVAIPARGKIVGAYVNSALAKTDAMLDGYDEAIVLTWDGHASEGSAENLFMVRDGVLITPPVTDEILEGITRAALMLLATEMGIPVVERSIDRTELYVADEVLLCGTGAQVSSVIEVDHRKVGGGVPGPITTRLQARYFEIVRGNVPAYAHWLTPVYER